MHRWTQESVEHIKSQFEFLEEDSKSESERVRRWRSRLGFKGAAWRQCPTEGISLVTELHFGCWERWQVPEERLFPRYKIARIATLRSDLIGTLRPLYPSPKSFFANGRRGRYMTRVRSTQITDAYEQ